jgi:CelD/BcsL family acetyltransferase involved in cellulose biosynthesis/RimJ/RimL family protein N-acetyltransferase
MTRVHVIHPSDLGAAEIAMWHRMQQATPSMAHPFLSPEYAMTVGRVRPQSRIGVLSEGPSVIGFFPFEARRFGVGVPVSGWLSACQGVIHKPGAQWSISELLSGCGLSAWRFDNLIAEQAAYGTFHINIASSPVIDLGEGFDAYYTQVRKRSGRFCREIERKARKIGREMGTLRLELDSRNPDLLSTLIRWKSDQYRRTATVDRFDRPWIPRLLQALLATRSDHLSGLLSVLYAGDEPVSIQCGLRAGEIVVGWFTGYDHRFGKYSPGLLQIKMMTETLCTLGVRTMYMGKGAKHSAQIFKNEDILVAEGVATDRSLLGTAHRVFNDIDRQALRTVRGHPGLHSAADRVLRRTGASSRLYGRVLARKEKLTVVERIRGWPATLTVPDLLDEPVVLRPLRVVDARDEREVREANVSWLRPWQPSDPEQSRIRSALGPSVSLIRQSPIRPYLSVVRHRWAARRGIELLWAVRYGEHFVGQLIIWSIIWGPCRSAKVGYWIDERFAGRAITPTVLAMAVDYCFTVAGLHRIEAGIRPENAASRRVVEKLGFREEGVRVREVHIDGAWRDHICYAITAEDVPAGLVRRWRSSLAVSRSST